jgi:uncharacterized membrane protein YfhO
VARTGFDPEREVILEAPADAARASGGSGTAEVVATGNPDRVVIQVEAPEGGWLVLSDIWYPGWEASIDGVPSAAYPAFGAFRAVWVPPGSSAVTWDYAPVAFRAGLGLTAGALILVIGASLWWLAQRRSA